MKKCRQNHKFQKKNPEVLRKGVLSQNFHSPKKCCEKGAVLRKGGVAKRATSGVYKCLFTEMMC